MATCRICRGVYPQDQFISGNGPRYLVCNRCGVEEGYVSDDDVPSHFDDATVKGRYTLVARRYAPWFWLGIGWTLWALFFVGTPLWGNAALAVLVLSTLGIPVFHILGGAKFQANLRRLTP
jgi:hypothetical protein